MINQLKFSWYGITGLILLLTSSWVVANEADPLFQFDDRLQISLSGATREVTRDSADEPEYKPGKLAIKTAAGEQIWFDVGIRPRGKSRRNREFCRFPPLKINFKKKQTANTVFAHQDKLKLVTHCQPAGRFEQYVILEYLIYKSLNLLTDNSFKVRLLEMQYLDGDADRKPRIGFFIEHKDRMAKRISHSVAEIESVSPHELEAMSTSVVELFQFMIGNTDFSFLAGPDLQCCHNLVLFENDGLFIPVAYDFDSTGLVNPPHAFPQPALKIKSVRQRLFRGFCGKEESLLTTVKLFKESKAQIYALFSEDQGLTKRSVISSRKYLDRFFTIIEQPERLEKKILGKCRSTKARLKSVS